MIELKQIVAGYQGKTVLDQISLDIPSGGVFVLVGPNGSGKSTLLRIMCGLQPVIDGAVFINGVPLLSLSQKDLARQVAYLPQSRNVPSITAGRMVLHGRFPYLSYPRRYGREDYEKAYQALTWVNGGEFADRLVSSLSGGQRQKVYLAMALAQDTPVILMDEPTTWLDIGNQLELMELAKQLAKEGKTVILALHDLGMALQYADRVAVLDEKKLQAAGTPEEIYDSGILDRVFGIALKRLETADGGLIWHISRSL